MLLQLNIIDVGVNH